MSKSQMKDAEIEMFRSELHALVKGRTVRRRRFDGIEVIRVIVPEGLHVELWRRGALVLPGTIALVWIESLPTPLSKDSER